MDVADTVTSIDFSKKVIGETRPIHMIILVSAAPSQHFMAF